MKATDNLEQDRVALTMIQPAPFNAEAPPEALASAITPTDLHYVRSNFALPTHTGVLAIGGAVRNAMTLTLDDLRAMPVVERTVTLECAGNGRLAQTPLPVGEPWGNYAVSTARWTGALLHQVLAQALPASDAVEVVFQGADHGPYYQHDDISFVRSLSLTNATDPTAEILIAYDMNGQPLRPDHGAPFRLIAPHWYGVASVKWLQRIDVTTEPYQGEFQTGHYMYEWADRRAKLEPPTGPYGWQDWSFDWDAVDAGRHALRARATDAAGNVQPDVPPWNRLGYGNNAVEVIYVDVHQ